MSDEPKRFEKILKLLNRPEKLREALLKLREELIEAGGRPVSRRSAWNVDPGEGIYEGQGVDQRIIRETRAMHAPKDVRKQKPVIDVFPSEKTLDIYAHFPRLYRKEDISVKLESSEGKQRLCIATPDSVSIVDLGAKAKGLKWKLNNDTLIISVEKEKP